MMTLILAIQVILFISNLTILYLMVQYLGVKLVFTKPRSVGTEPPKVELTPEEQEKIKIMKRRSDADLEAFNTLMSYNPSIAYGIQPNETDEEE